MKGRAQVAISEGFDKSVAEKMPKIGKEEMEPFANLDMEAQTPKEEPYETEQMIKFLEGKEEKIILSPPQKETSQDLEVLKLIEDLHNQLLASGRKRRTLEVDLTSHQKTFQQLSRDNNDLRNQLEGLKKELQKLQEVQSESIYLKEENEEAFEKIQELQEEVRHLKEVLSRTTQEKEEALNRMQHLESKMEQTEFLKVKERMKEREVSHFSEENRELQSKLKEAFAKNMDLEEKYEALRKSFNEVRESLILLRDSYKANYYDLSETSE